MALPLSYDIFLLYITEITREYLEQTPSIHCLCADHDFAKELLRETPEIQAVEWATSMKRKVVNKEIVFSKSNLSNAQILTALFVPVSSVLSISLGRSTYYPAADNSQKGRKFPLYLPLFIFFQTLKLTIRFPSRYNNKVIPLTLFYASLRLNTSNSFLSGTSGLETHIKRFFQTLHQAYGTLEKVCFLVKGRFIKDDYVNYIVDNYTSRASLENFELVSVYTPHASLLKERLRRDNPSVYFLS